MMIADRLVPVRPLARTLFSWARQFHSAFVHPGVISANEFNAGGNPSMASHPGGSRNTPSLLPLSLLYTSSLNNISFFVKTSIKLVVFCHIIWNLDNRYLEIDSKTTRNSLP